MSFFHEHPWSWPRPRSSPLALSLSSQLKSSSGLSSKPQASAPSPHLCRWTSIPGWDMQGGGPDRLCRSVLLCLQQTSCCIFLWVSEAPSLSSLITPLAEGAFQSMKNLLFSSFLQGTSPVLLRPFFFLFTWPGYVEIFLILPGIWGLLLVFSRCPLRKSSICRHIFDVFVRQASSTFFYSTIVTGTLSFILDFCWHN